jgi:hypothetical protein
MISYDVNPQSFDSASSAQHECGENALDAPLTPCPRSGGALGGMREANKSFI